MNFLFHGASPRIGVLRAYFWEPVPGPWGPHLIPDALIPCAPSNLLILLASQEDFFTIMRALWVFLTPTNKVWHLYITFENLLAVLSYSSGFYCFFLSEYLFFCGLGKSRFVVPILQMEKTRPTEGEVLTTQLRNKEKKLTGVSSHLIEDKI